MAKSFNALTLKRPERPVRVYTRADLHDATKTVTLAIRSLDTVDGHRLHDRVEQLTKKFITGEGEDKPLDFIVGDDVVALTPSLVWAAAMLETMQVPDHDDADYWTAEELMAIAATLPTLWAQLTMLPAQPEVEPDPNDLGANTD